jgi:hypothetical protein
LILEQNEEIMTGKITYLIFIIMFFLTSGCVKETYDTNKLSKNSHLSPTMAFPIVYGKVSFGELTGLSFRTPSIELMYKVGNFMRQDGSDGSNPVRPENFEMLRLDIDAKNGFPLQVALQLSLLNSAANVIEGTVAATDNLAAAPIDKNGKVTGAAETKTGIKFTKEFLRSIPLADTIIFEFRFNTSNNGANYVSIYSDYNIDFKAALVFKPDLYLK